MLTPYDWRSGDPPEDAPDPEPRGHVCGTCRADHDLDAWLSLRLAGHSGRRDSNGQWEALEMRHCGCGSTLARVVRWDDLGDD